MIAKVMLISNKHVIDQVFDYAVPPELCASVGIGMRCLVPFGIYNNSVEALIVALADKSEVASIKNIISIIGTQPVCGTELLKLCELMRRKYFCSFYSAFKLIVPPKMKLIITEWISLGDAADEKYKKLTPFRKKIVDAIRENGGIIEYTHLYESVGSSALRRSLDVLKSENIVKSSEKIDESIRELTVRYASLNMSVDDAYVCADELRSKRAYVQSDMMYALADSGKLMLSDLIALTNGNYESIRRLFEKGYIELKDERKIRETYDPSTIETTTEYEPTDEQRPIIEYVDGLLDKNKHEEILIRGVTGSGKTEVFLQTIKHCIESGKRAIMLVPEISLTPQMVERFVGRFGERVAVMHSGLSYGERYDQWTKIRNNEVDVVVGARSAIFSPIENIGLIIMDEEHEHTYKSEISPRYHARDIAKYRAEYNKAPLILASATPSLDSYYRACETKEYKLFEMNKRYNSNALPDVQIVDMRSEIFDYHNMSPISGRLEFEIRKNLENGEQTILFLNRRGYNTFVSCRECGYVMECESCSIPLTYHKHADSLVCHYCGYTKRNVTECPSCGSKYIKYFGTGTQKIEDELLRIFPSIRILRMDRDTTSTKGSHEHILNAFQEKQADVLLGTQMVTKGLDFANVTLVGVLAADSSLGADDFRANERTFSLLTQVCGRAGRGDVKGRAIIQTYQPKNATIEYAKNHDYVGFYKNEIRFRKNLNYPPFCDIISILVQGEDENAVKSELGIIYGFIQEKANDNIIKMTSPMPAPINKIKRCFRHRILLKVKDVNRSLGMLHSINNWHNKKSNDTTLIIDTNPINMS